MQNVDHVSAAERCAMSILGITIFVRSLSTELEHVVSHHIIQPLSHPAACAVAHASLSTAAIYVTQPISNSKKQSPLINLLNYLGSS